MNINLIKNLIIKKIDFLLFFFIENKKKNFNDVILFISEMNVPRLNRQLKYLTKIRKEEIIVFIRKDKFFSKFKDKNTDYKIILFRNEYHLEYLIKAFKNIKLIHGCESRSIYPYVATKFPNIPFIYDFQDLYINYYGFNPKQIWIKKNLPFEKTCLKHASHLISYSLEIIPARKTYQLSKKPTLYFPFYLDDESIQFKKKKQASIIEIVYVGGISDIIETSSFNMYNLVKTYNNLNLILHIYPSPSTPQYIIENYKKLNLSNLVIHESVSQKILSEEISKYDFGIIPFHKVEGFISDTKFKYSTTLKLFNYLEAGLPVIVSEYTSYQAWIVNHYKIGKTLKDNQFQDLYTILRNLNYKELKEAIKNYQKNNLLSNNINKINNIYTKIIETRI